MPTRTYQLVLSADNDVVDVGRLINCTAIGTTLTVNESLPKPGADTVSVGLPLIFSMPCTVKLTVVDPLGTLMTIDVVPAVVAFGDTRTRDGSLLVTVTGTPPC